MALGQVQSGLAAVRGRALAALGRADGGAGSPHHHPVPLQLRLDRLIALLGSRVFLGATATHAGAEKSVVLGESDGVGTGRKGTRSAAVDEGEVADGAERQLGAQCECTADRTDLVRVW